MADIPTLEPATELAETGPTEGKRKRSWLIPIIAAVIVLVGAGAGGWLLLHHGAAKSKAAHVKQEPLGPPLYISLDPPFVTNFQPNDVARFLQVAVEVLTHDKATADIIKANDPVIRNNLLLLFSNQKYSDLASAQGKDRLRAEALTAVRQVVAANGGDASRVDAIYFTSFVMQ
jgi:flagellar protein FliL